VIPYLAIAAMTRLSPALLAVTALALPLCAQTSVDSLTFTADVSAQPRFAAAHGQNAILMGYTGYGLEAWAYPFQLFTHLHLQIVPQDAPAPIDADPLLHRIEYRPDEIVRIYNGPGYEIRERLFVPLDRPGVILSWDVHSARRLDLRVTFLPVLDLMWPAALGGQDLHWNAALPGYVASEFTTGFRAVIASPQAIDHTPVVNATLRQDLTQSMVLRSTDGHAELFAALESKPVPEGSVLQSLKRDESQLRAGYRSHVAQFLATGLRIHTPEEAFNRTLTWSRLALGESWVCNPRIGCGTVGGYGPSRPERRPQYDWFFAGDGLVAVEGLLATGDIARARDELAFIFRYQNPDNGMIWHEISQSAGFLDWAGKYPYMYVHVDITFGFLSTLADYYADSGDAAFLRDHWQQIDAAYRYCRSLIDPQTALPKIPAGKEGGNEQQRMSEDVSLSASWVTASAAYRTLALAAGHSDEAETAAAPAEAARRVFSARYWDPQKHFWIAGFTAGGAPMADERSHPDLLGNGLLTADREEAALDRLAGSAFETDWGTRSMSSASPGYDPRSYASGSVFALSTADMAQAFWRDHRPAVGAPIFESLLPWSQMDALGHIHEVADGDRFAPEVESVPEQTWSSSGFLHAAIRGLFGLDVNAAQRTLTLVPHLDPRWDHVSISQIPIGPAQVAVDLDQHPSEIDALFTAQSGPVHIDFAPEIPLGATRVRAFVDGRSVPAALEVHGEDEHARIAFDLPVGSAHVRILSSGGLRIHVPIITPARGDVSRGLRLTAFHLDGRTLTVDADVASADHSSIEIETPWTVSAVHGGSAARLSPDWYRVTFDVPRAPALFSSVPVYAHCSMTIAFRDR
jgi:glycogen debranching enzyme